jgi:hypothetical protein
MPIESWMIRARWFCAHGKDRFEFPRKHERLQRVGGTFLGFSEASHSGESDSIDAPQKAAAAGGACQHRNRKEKLHWLILCRARIYDGVVRVQAEGRASRRAPRANACPYPVARYGRGRSCGSRLTSGSCEPAATASGAALRALALLVLSVRAERQSRLGPPASCENYV